MTSTPNPQTTLRLALDAAEKLLAEGPHPERARRDAQTLLVHVLKKHAPDTTLAGLIAHDADPLVPSVDALYRQFIERRLAGEPIQYITGETEFYGLRVWVNRDVLIPRPETEHLVEAALELAENQWLAAIGSGEDVRPLRIADVGTGSGAIALALATRPFLSLIAAIDISSAALSAARLNATRNGMGDHIRFLQGDLLAPVVGEQFDLIVSNPPYVSERDRATLDVEVRDYEPAEALFAGEDGLAVYRRLIPEAFKALMPGGILLLEIGYGQREAIQALLADEGFEGIDFFDDLQGIPRVAKAQRG